jgi:hypothetical protein
VTEQSGTAAASENRGESSIGDLLGDTADVVVRATQAWAEVRSDWEDRSRTDASWTTDTIMNEVVNSWERVTPLMGEAIDAGIAGMTWLLRNWWPSATEDLQVIQDSVQESPVGSVLGPYLDPPHDAVSRMLRDDYRSADVVEHWAQLFGMTVKEAWRA